MKEYINDYLSNYIDEKHYPWHMPGHKRKGEFKETDASAKMLNLAASLDFTESYGLDDLHEPEDFIKESLLEISKIYKSKASFMLVNGSTSGIMAAIHACLDEGDRVIVARNSHKSVYNSLLLKKAIPTYICPKIDEYGIMGDITLDMIKEVVDKRDDYKAVIITSPTYEGVISDIKSIANYLRDKGIILIVDEAHGAHLEYMEGFESAVEAGADIVIESTHKTLPALTQTGLIHVNNEKLIDSVKKYLDIFLTSSPSYVFMQSIEKAVSYSDSNRDKYVEYATKLADYKKRFDEVGFKSIKLYEPKDVFKVDPSKLVFVTANGGSKLFDMLAKEYGQSFEMAAGNYVIAMTSIWDSDEDYAKLLDDLKDIDGKSESVTSNNNQSMKEYEIPKPGILAHECEKMPSIWVDMKDACGKISAGYVYAYPPGIPILTPGEIIDKPQLEYIDSIVKGGLKVIGIKKDESDNIYLNIIRGDK